MTVEGEGRYPWNFSREQLCLSAKYNRKNVG